MMIIKHHIVLLLLLLLLPIEIPVHGLLLLVWHLELIPHTIHGHAYSPTSGWVHEIIASSPNVVHVNFSVHHHAIHVHAAGTATMMMLLLLKASSSSVAISSHVGMTGHVGQLRHVNVVWRGMTRIVVGVGRLLCSGGSLVGSHGFKNHAGLCVSSLNGGLLAEHCWTMIY